MGGTVSRVVDVVAGVIPALIGAIRGSEVNENPTMVAIEEELQRLEAEKRQAQQRAEQLEQARQAQAEAIRIQQEAAQKATEYAEQLEKERRAQAERIRVLQEEAQRAAQTAEQLEREKQEQMENARKEREAAQRAAQAANDLQEQQKAMEAKWRKGIKPIEWPSREQFEANKQRFYKDGKFHLAIAGISGTGKSSLINALRGIWDGDEGAAMTDIVESTAVVTPYPDPNPANPFIWFDVPGSGTLSCSDWTYFNDQGLYIFDAIIVLFNDRFTATDIAILKNCERYNIPTYIVRSKSDIHIDNLVKKKRRGAGAKSDPAKILDQARKEYITKTQESVRLNLMKNDPPIRSQKMYAVSRDTLTVVVKEEPLEDCLVLNELELLRDILQDAYSRRSEKREREATQRAAAAANELQKHTGIHPVEWPSKETYEATKLRFYKEGKFHLAIAGISGTGKSSLINAFRGIWDDDEGAAMTDIVESTSVVTPYLDPNPANPLIWFDVPGSGTLACSDWTYFNDQGLYVFDAIIILFNDRFTATDIAILKNCERYNIPTYIVRSKSDIHIENIIQKKMRGAKVKANPASAEILDEARKEYLARTKESVRLNLMKSDPPIKSQRMYAVSRDTLTMVVREEPLEGVLVLDESELLRDILQDGYSRRFEKSYGRMSDVIKKTGMGIIRFIAI
ncbi:P-loop containing nucleoside triphosphate hydrolase protein [Armillaria nabsnona]|nr:P-loop containing nucleoside triphosphate hydrolase protein [Armillaria nabsnona]